MGREQSQSCRCSTTALQTQFVQIKPSLSPFMGQSQSAVAQLLWLEVSPTQLQPGGHSALASRELQAGCISILICISCGCTPTLGWVSLWHK